MLAPSLSWQGPCRLEASLLQQRLLDYDRSTYDFVGIAEEIFSSNHLGGLHQAPVRPWDQTPPALRRGQVQARIGCSVSKQERKGARRNAWDFEKSIAWKKFTRCYQRFILEWVAPQLGDDGGALLYQRKPILRVVLPGSVAPTALHCDAEYYHDPNELNYWVPLSSVSGSNSLWSESAPGAGDYTAFEAEPGQAVRFYVRVTRCALNRLSRSGPVRLACCPACWPCPRLAGLLALPAALLPQSLFWQLTDVAGSQPAPPQGNRCRHYTVGNDSDQTRVSFDFRVIPQRLFVPPSEEIVKLSKHSLNPGNSKRGYYAVAYPSSKSNDHGTALRRQQLQIHHPSQQRSVELGAQRRAWRSRAQELQQQQAEFL